MKIIKSGLKFKGKLSPIVQKVTNIIIHHAVTGLTATIHDIHSWHLNKGWMGCGYNFVIYPNGDIFEGRGFNIGSHSGAKWNPKSIGICLIGNFELKPPTKEQYKGLAELCLMLMVKYKLSATDIIPHSAVMQTACCGRLFKFETLMNEIKVLLRPKQAPVQPRPEMKSLPKNEFWVVQAGAYKTEGEARTQAEKLEKAGFDTYCYLKQD